MALSLEDPVIQTFMLYSSILAVKVLILSPMTAVTRLIKGVFANPEDVKALKGKIQFDDPHVERIRRAHLNDLENIPAFWVIGAVYVTTGPAFAVAANLFRVYTAGRIIHSIVYAVIPLPQPSRVIAFGVPFCINLYMGVQSIIHYITAF